MAILKIPITSELETILNDRVLAAGMDVTDYVLKLLAETVTPIRSAFTTQEDAQRRLKISREWMATIPARSGLKVDSSRDSIYE